MAAAFEMLELFVAQVGDHLFQARMLAEKVFADEVSGFDRIFLVLPVHAFVHALGQQAVFVVFENGVPVAPPDDFDDIPLRAAKEGFQFLDDLGVSANGTVQALQVTVNDKNQIIEFFA